MEAYFHFWQHHGLVKKNNILRKVIAFLEAGCGLARVTTYHDFQFFLFIHIAKSTLEDPHQESYVILK